MPPVSVVVPAWLPDATATAFLPAALDTGLDETSGDHVAYLPHDDLWTREHLETLVAALDADVDVIYALLNWQAVPFAASVLRQKGDVPFVWHYKEGDRTRMAEIRAQVWARRVDFTFDAHADELLDVVRKAAT